MEAHADCSLCLCAQSLRVSRGAVVVRDSDELYPGSQRLIGGKEVLFVLTWGKHCNRQVWIHERHLADRRNDAGLEHAVTHLHIPYHVEEVQMVGPRRVNGVTKDTDKLKLCMRCTYIYIYTQMHRTL